jgi:pseudaminic acid biosynthesis-associated methylase
MADPHDRDPDRLERLWAGQFGVDYAERNAVAVGQRAAFWDGILDRHGIRSALEVGCGQGANLAPIARRLEGSDVWGIDVGAFALSRARELIPSANLVRSWTPPLPFRDRFVDLVFTVGVLIHQPDEALPEMVDEIVRCADRYVLWAEYHAAATEEVPYHGEAGALFRRDYGAVYGARHPELTIVEEGFLDRDAGFDRVTWQLLAVP